MLRPSVAMLLGTIPWNEQTTGGLTIECGRTSGLFAVLTLTNQAANTFLCRILRECKSSFLQDKCPGVQWLGGMVIITCLVF